MLDCADPRPNAEDEPAAGGHPGIGFFDLRDHTCHWPLWGGTTPGLESKRFCGAGVALITKRDGTRGFGPYCLCHARLAAGHSGMDIARVVLRAVRGESAPAPKGGRERSPDVDAPQPRVRDPLPLLPLAPRPAALPPEDVGAVLVRYAALDRKFRTGQAASAAKPSPWAYPPVSSAVVRQPVAEETGPEGPPEPDMPEPRITVAAIIAHVCAHYRVSRMDLLSQRRTARVVRPRQIAMWLAKTLTLHSYPVLGRAFGGRDHTTILHAVCKFDALRRLSPEVTAELDALVGAIEGEGVR